MEDKTKDNFNLGNFILSKKQHLIGLDLRKYAQRQLLNEGITNTSIEVSSLCTYKFHDEFNSWRKNKTLSRQWSFIST